eukprot:CAMPEP_0195102608 /NCGR_PEP_ID=MMETSP0448-20130528/68548_1 /TAXON_ID=66468 /ORGANISM="Heterocapsa triquestra, Strain CCMP 448" /LENGTH=378 /DNA_ID=CAMNT_0040138131 /DNA_START=54 /DNA_END=1190 /DNA_ORIENTATION=-
MGDIYVPVASVFDNEQSTLAAGLPRDALEVVDTQPAGGNHLRRLATAAVFVVGLLTSGYVASKMPGPPAATAAQPQSMSAAASLFLRVQRLDVTNPQGVVTLTDADADVKATSRAVALWDPSQATKTATSKTRPSGSSLFCYTWLRAHRDEELLRAQANWGDGLFACDEWSVYAARPTWLLNPTRNDTEVLDHVTLPHTSCDDADISEFCWVSNVELFKSVWRNIIERGVHERNDWIVKVNANTVFLPPRLHAYMDAKGPQGAVFYTSCAISWSLMSDSLEVVSRGGFEALAHGGLDRCDAEVDFDNDQESACLSRCLDHLGVARVLDLSILADYYCDSNTKQCEDQHAIAFQPPRDKASFMECHMNASRIDIEPFHV